MFKKVLAGGGAVFCARIMGLVSSFALSVFLARSLEPDQVGAYFFAFNLVTFLAIFGRFGVEKVIIRLMADAINSNESPVSLLRPLFFLVSASLASLFVLGFWSSDWVLGDLFNMRSLASCAGLLFCWLALVAVQAVQAEILRAGNFFLIAGLARGPVAYFLMAITIAYWWFSGDNFTLADVLQLAVLSGCVSVVLAALFILAQMKRYKAEGFKVTAVVSVVTMMSMALPLLLNQLAMFLATQSDLWIVAAYYSSEDVAIYGAAARLVLLTGLALTIANAVLPPFISKFKIDNDPVKLERLVRAVATVAAVPALLAMGVFIVVPETILGLIYGVEYQAGARVLMILSFGQIANVLAGSCGYVLVMYGHGKQLMYSALVGGAVSILGALFVAEFGLNLIWLAAAFSMGLIVQQIIMLYSCKKLTSIRAYVNYPWNIKNALTL